MIASMQLPPAAPDGGGGGGDGAAAGGGGAPPPRAKKKAKVPDNPLTQAGYGEEFDVVVELDPKEYMSSTMTVRMRRNAPTGYPECVSGATVARIANGAHRLAIARTDGAYGTRR